ncbi:ASCH domain-containing protein [Alkalibacillus sp. S2W]|uniref:ASCH domain-containing protein n=1 Tax=Alkalibacillus sp. S2W TaxID=3386553 RepID=UPI00398D5B8C
MEHNMGLYESPFNSIKTGKKKVEVRLNDEKRRILNPGDTIKFSKVPHNKETLTVEIIELRHFSTFKEMYENVSASDLDAVGQSIDEMVERTYQIYTPEQENEWGTVAIKIKLLGENL